MIKYVPVDPNANGVNREYYKYGILHVEINNPDDLRRKEAFDKVCANVRADMAGLPRPYLTDKNGNFIN